MAVLAIYSGFDVVSGPEIVVGSLEVAAEPSWSVTAAGVDVDYSAAA